MKGKFNPYTININLFNETYKELGGIKKYIKLRMAGDSYKKIGKYFGFTPQRSQQIGRALMDNGVVLSRSNIEDNLIKNIVQEVQDE